MLLDFQNLFSDQQAITASAASTNIIDTGAPGNSFSGQAQPRDVGVAGAQLFATVDVTFATIVTLEISLQTDTAVGFGTLVTLWKTGLIPVASMVAGYHFSMPRITWRAQRYLRLFYTVATSATAGKITAGVTLENQRNPIG